MQETNFLALFRYPREWIEDLINEINNAKNWIYIEIYRFVNDPTGIRVRDALVEKAKENIKVYVLVDSFGAKSDTNFFKPLIEAGGQVRFFTPIPISLAIFSEAHRRNHRKIIVIDQISYLGSANISNYSLDWRDSIFKFDDPDLARRLVYFIKLYFKHYKTYTFNQKKFHRIHNVNGMELIREIPSIWKQRIRKKLNWLLDNSQKSIKLATPYFLPMGSTIDALIEAAIRGVDTQIYLPFRSDVSSMDVLRNYYLGKLWRAGIRIFFYLPTNLHAKLLLLDNEQYMIGSCNYDYRSYLYMHEINMVAKDPVVVNELEKYFSELKQDSIEFDYDRWRERPVLDKIIEKILIPFRFLF